MILGIMPAIRRLLLFYDSPHAEFHISGHIMGDQEHFRRNPKIQPFSPILDHRDRSETAFTATTTELRSGGSHPATIKPDLDTR